MSRLERNAAGFLFDPGPRPRRRPWHGGMEIELASPRCPTCTMPTGRRGVIQAPLFYHGGFGEAQSDTIEFCALCGWSGRFLRRSVNPRHLVSQ